MAEAKPRAGTIAMAVFGVVALLCYVWFLSANFTTVNGDAVVGQAFETLVALALLWILIFVLLAFDRGLGGRSWPRRIGFFLAPIAAIATTFVTDYRHDGLCQSAIVGLPLLFGIYLLLGRLAPQRATIAQATTLLPVAMLSAYAILRFCS